MCPFICSNPKHTTSWQIVIYANLPMSKRRPDLFTNVIRYCGQLLLAPQALHRIIHSADDRDVVHFDDV